MQEWCEGWNRKPGDADFALQLAWVKATCPDDTIRNGSEAVVLATAVSKAGPGASCQTLDILAAAYAEDGDFAKAVETAEQGLALARAKPEAGSLAKNIEARLINYRAGKPWRSP